MVQSVLKDTMFTAIFVAYFIYYIKLIMNPEEFWSNKWNLCSAYICIVVIM